jgi:hypothetical protein
VPPAWLDGLRTVVQPVVGALPALLVVLFAGVLAFLGLFFRSEGRTYALEYADRLVDLASVVVGAPRAQPEPSGVNTGRSGGPALTASLPP